MLHLFKKEREREALESKIYEVCIYLRPSLLINTHFYIILTPGSKESRELAASNWVKNTCRDIQTAYILRRAPLY